MVELGHFLWVLHFLKSLQFLHFHLPYSNLYKNELYRERILLSLFLEWNSQGLSSPGRYSMVRQGNGWKVGAPPQWEEEGSSSLTQAVKSSIPSGLSNCSYGRFLSSLTPLLLDIFSSIHGRLTS